MGRRKRPFYRIVAIDSRTRRDGPEIERLGWFDPLKTDVAVELKEDRIIHWLEQGAQLSEKVNTIFSSTGLQYKLHLMREGKSEEEIAAALIEWRLGQDEKQARKAEKKLAKKKAATPVVEEIADGEAPPAEESVELEPVAKEAQDAKSDDSQVEEEAPVVAEESEEVKASEESAVEAETSDDSIENVEDPEEEKPAKADEVKADDTVVEDEMSTEETEKSPEDEASSSSEAEETVPETNESEEPLVEEDAIDDVGESEEENSKNESNEDVPETESKEEGS